MEILLLIMFVSVLGGGWYMLRDKSNPWIHVATATVLLCMAWVFADPGPIGPRILLSAVALYAAIEAIRRFRARRSSQLVS